MPRPDTDNAHIRAATKRGSPAVAAAESVQLLENPAFIRAVDLVREGLVQGLEKHAHDGSPAAEDFEAELCRQLRSLCKIQLALTKTGQLQQLRVAEFRSVDPTSVDETEDG